MKNNAAPLNGRGSSSPTAHAGASMHGPTLSCTALARLFMHLMPATAICAAGRESLRGLLGGVNHLYC